MRLWSRPSEQAGSRSTTRVEPQTMRNPWRRDVDSDSLRLQHAGFGAAAGFGIYQACRPRQSPFIVVSGTIGEETAGGHDEAVRNDYCLKQSWAGWSGDRARVGSGAGTRKGRAATNPGQGRF